MRRHSATVTSTDEHEAAYARAKQATADAQLAYDAAYRDYNTLSRERDNAYMAFYNRLATRVTRLGATEKQRLSDAALAAYEAYNNAVNAQRAYDRAERERLNNAGVAYRDRWQTRQADRWQTASDRLTATRDAYERAGLAEKRLGYIPGMRAPSEKNNGGECVIAPTGTIYMVPEYQDHSDVWEALTDGGRHGGHASEWVRVAANGGVSTCEHGSMPLDRMTQAQIDSLADVAAAHMDKADSYGEDERYAARIHRAAHDAIMTKIAPPPMDED